MLHLLDAIFLTLKSLDKPKVLTDPMTTRACHYYLFSKKIIGASFFGVFLCIYFRGENGKLIFWFYLLNFGLQICLDPLIRQNIFCSVYMLYGTQNDRQKSVLNYMHWVLIYWPKCARILGSKPNLPILRHFVHISGLSTYFSKPIFFLKP